MVFPCLFCFTMWFPSNWWGYERDEFWGQRKSAVSRAENTRRCDWRAWKARQKGGEAMVTAVKTSRDAVGNSCCWPGRQPARSLLALRGARARCIPTSFPCLPTVARHGDRTRDTRWTGAQMHILSNTWLFWAKPKTAHYNDRIRNGSDKSTSTFPQNGLDFPGFSNSFECKELSSSGGLPLGGY